MKDDNTSINLIRRLIQPWSLVIFLSIVNPLNAQMKIYINTDLEGISGVFQFAQTREKGTALNVQACEYFMGDLAAVIKGLQAGGATEIVVLDGHGNQAIIPHLMVPGATYVTGKPRPGVANLTGLDESFAGMVMLGFHAMMGTPDGVLSHTQSSKTENRYWYNGVESGELAQNAAIAGYFNVPLIMFTGDEATCREARTFFGEEVVTVATKRGLAREAAELYPFEETRQALFEGAKRAMEAIKKCKPYKMELPIKGKLEYLDLNSNLTDPKRVTKEKTFDSVLDILKF
ncbi:MAG: M55 family metallopeptidase [Cyclobacteriaceae bacterium]|nr:M55 family metallopeptidase [Cyclobacteriaceae bacterium]